MPAAQFEVTDARRHRIRHVRPYAAGLSLTPSATVLGKQMGFAELPISQVPNAPDFAEASWTGRLNDAGEGSVQFPNRPASDGPLWRNRFDTDGHNEFLEFYRDDVLEQVVCILKGPVDQQAVTVAGQDGWFLLRDAYERDFQAIMAPRDVIERYTYVWDGLLLDDFTANVSLVESNEGVIGAVEDHAIEVSRVLGESGPHSGSLETVPAGLLVLAQNSSLGELQWRIAGKEKSAFATNTRWTLTVPITVTALTARPFIEVGMEDQTTATKIRVGVLFNETPEEVEQLNAATAFMWTGSGSVRQVALPLGAAPGPHTFALECDGRFVRGYVDGYLIGILPAEVQGAKGGKVAPTILVSTDTHGGAPASKIELILNQWVFRVAEPFLMRGSDKGDHVLPGNASTFPYGGITGRYYNDLDMQGLAVADHLGRRFAQNRPGPGPGGSYKDRTDTVLDLIDPPLPGAAANWFSVRWFGAVYLKLSQGDYTFRAGLGPTSSARLWVGKTQFGDQVIDTWTNGATRELEATVSATALGGKDGWYPIVLEFATGSEGASHNYIHLEFRPPAEYSDPGGSVLKAATFVIVPATSLTPYGCVDQRFQGQSHFTITQEVAAAFGYQMRCEPAQLESGNFPGQLIPRVRVGRDTDEIIQKDAVLVKSPISGYKSVIDATDQATSMRGTGAGLPTAQNSGQIQVEQFDIPAMKSALFDLQGWVDASDTNSPALLGIRIQSQLDLQSTPWQNVEGEPLARDRLAFGFPLTGPLAAFHWQPGDGVRLNLPDIGLEDTVPRQITQVTRQFGPVGRHGSQVGFRSRPLDRLSAVNKAIKRVTQPQRNYQGSVVNLPAMVREAEIAAGVLTYAMVPLLPSDQIVSAVLVVMTNSTQQPLKISNLPNASFIDVTAAVGGPVGGFVGLPLTIDISRVIVPRNSVKSMAVGYIGVTNAGASATNLVFTLAVSVLRV